MVRGGVPRPINASDVLEAGDSVNVSLESPVNLTADRLELWLDQNVPLPTHPESPSADPRRWQFNLIVPADLSESSHEFDLRIQRRDGTFITRAQAFQGTATGGPVALSQVYNFPNPFEENTEFFYSLNRTVAEVTLSIYTLSGRRIKRMVLDDPRYRRPNENSILWDGRDQDGDPVSNGLYFYKIEARGLDGKKVSRIEKVVRMR